MVNLSLYKEHKFRPWPKGDVEYIEVNISPKWTDLCWIRPADGWHVYLSSRPRDNSHDKKI